MSVYFIDSDVYLKHYGVKGQKWGVRKKQAKSGNKRRNTKTVSESSSKTSTTSSTKASKGSKIQQRIKARLAGRKTTALQSREAKAKAKLKKINAEKKVNALEQQVSIEEKKAAVLKQRSGKALYKNADLFTTDELAQATRRLQLEKTLREIDPKTKSKAEQYLDKAKKLNDTMKMVNDTIETSAKLYNTINKYASSSSKAQRKKD